MQCFLGEAEESEGNFRRKRGGNIAVYEIDVDALPLGQFIAKGLTAGTSPRYSSRVECNWCEIGLDVRCHILYFVEYFLELVVALPRTGVTPSLKLLDFNRHQGKALIDVVVEIASDAFALLFCPLISLRLTACFSSISSVCPIVRCLRCHNSPPMTSA